MKIAFYIGNHGTFYDKVISFVTKSKYSHCEIVLSNGICVSSSPRDGGIRFKNIDLNTGKWETFDLNILSVSEQQVIDYFNKYENAKYHWIGALFSVFKISFTTNKRKFCSEACAHALGFNVIVTPGRLFKLLLKNNYMSSSPSS